MLPVSVVEAGLSSNTGERSELKISVALVREGCAVNKIRRCSVGGNDGSFEDCSDDGSWVTDICITGDLVCTAAGDNEGSLDGLSVRIGRIREGRDVKTDVGVTEEKPGVSTEPLEEVGNIVNCWVSYIADSLGTVGYCDGIVDGLSDEVDRSVGPTMGMLLGRIED